MNEGNCKNHKLRTCVYNPVILIFSSLGLITGSEAKSIHMVCEFECIREKVFDLDDTGEEKSKDKSEEMKMSTTSQEGGTSTV